MCAACFLVRARRSGCLEHITDVDISFSGARNRASENMNFSYGPFTPLELGDRCEGAMRCDVTTAVYE